MATHYLVYSTLLTGMTFNYLVYRCGSWEALVGCFRSSNRGHCNNSLTVAQKDQEKQSFASWGMGARSVLQKVEEENSTEAGARRLGTLGVMDVIVAREQMTTTVDGLGRGPTDPLVAGRVGTGLAICRHLSPLDMSNLRM